jgi:uncharacterized protein with GYD domain
MPKFLIRASYTQSGIAGVLKEGGSSRVKAVQTLTSSVGGKLESMYWTFGDDDVILIVDVPDNIAAATLSTTVSASGAVSVSSTPLLTADDIDAVSSRHADYTPPGG